MRRACVVVLVSLLVGAGLLRSHLAPLLALVALGAVAGLAVAIDRDEPEHLARIPLLGAGLVLVLVGAGQVIGRFVP